MKLWRITALDPLVVRDGRPNQGRSESATLAFPYPSTMAGVVRTRIGSDERGVFDRSQSLDALLRVELRGPLIERVVPGAALDDTLLVAAPRDALIVGAAHERVVRALHPLDESSIGEALMGDGSPGAPVGLDEDEHVDGKVPSNLPLWWRWRSVARWLASTPAQTENIPASEWLDGGLRALPRERRMHVALDAQRVARDAMLFSTEGLRFHDGETRCDLALLAAVQGGPDRPLREGVGPFAGERRTVRWSRRDAALPAIPEEIRTHVCAPGAQARVRVLLLTPTHWTNGSTPDLRVPGQPLGAHDDLGVTLDAALVGRPETISGWDAHRREPKGTRRLVSAGSVLWLTLHGSAEHRANWLDRVWMQNVSDDEQSRRDGFGLAVVGVR